MKKNNSILSPWMTFFWGPVLLVLLTLFDQLTKALAIRYLKNQADYVLIPDVLELSYLENRGMAFGVLQGKQLFLIAICALFFVAFLFFYVKVPKTRHYFPLILISLVMTAGAVGNFIDRIARGYVVDFIYFSLINFPVFNVADIYVVCSGIILILVMMVKYEEEGEFDFLKIGNKR